MITTEPPTVGVNVTEHFEELSVQVDALREPVEFVVNDTVPDGDEPDTVTETVVGLLRLTDDGESVTRVVVVDFVTSRVDMLELAASFVSPP